MKEFIKKFNNHNAYTAFTQTADFVKPNVSLCVQENEVHYNPLIKITLECVYNVDTTEDYIRLLRTEDESCSFDPIDMYEIFSEMEIDGVLQPELVDVYQFDTLGEHTVKYTLNEDITDFETAFCENQNLVSIIIPEGVTSLSSNAFNGCDQLISITIPNSVTSIGANVFSLCGLTSIIISKYVINIDSTAFNNSRLTSITVEEENPKYDSRNNCNAVIETNTNTLIAGCDNSVIPNSVTSIGDDAFHDCYIPTSIIIPNSVTSIGDRAFKYCIGLTSVTIPNSVISIGYAAFQECNRLASVTIGNSVTSIGNDAFENCGQLASVTIEAITPPTLGFSVFLGNKYNRKIYVPAGSVNAYKTATNWSDYANDIEAIP